MQQLTESLLYLLNKQGLNNTKCSSSRFAACAAGPDRNRVCRPKRAPGNFADPVFQEHRVKNELPAFDAMAATPYTGWRKCSKALAAVKEQHDTLIKNGTWSEEPEEWRVRLQSEIRPLAAGVDRPPPACLGESVRPCPHTGSPLLRPIHSRAS